MKRLLALVRAGCYAWSGTKRDLERALEIGHGRLEECLNGTRELRVCHLVNLARLLKVKPSDFLRLAYPEDEAAAPNQLEEWIGEPKPPFARKNLPPVAPEMAEEIRNLIREELAKAKPKAALVSERRLSASNNGYRSQEAVIRFRKRAAVPKRELPSQHGSIRPRMGTSVPEWEHSSQDGNFCPRTGTSVPGRELPSQDGNCRPGTGTSVPGRELLSQNGNLCRSQRLYAAASSFTPRKPAIGHRSGSSASREAGRPPKETSFLRK